jgi:hypothetical protein
MAQIIREGMDEYAAAMERTRRLWDLDRMFDKSMRKNHGSRD